MDAETTVIGQKNIVQSLGAFLDEPRVAAVAWVKLSAVYERLAEKFSEFEHRAKRIQIGSKAFEGARTVFILESLVKAVCDSIKHWETKEVVGFDLAQLNGIEFDHPLKPEGKGSQRQLMECDVEKYGSILKLVQEFAKVILNKDNEKSTVNKDGFARNSDVALQDDDNDVGEDVPKKPKANWKRVCKR